MNKTVISCIALYSFALFSCTDSMKKTAGQIEHLEMRNLKNIAFNEDSLLKTIVSDVEYIPLEETEESLIADMLDICLTDKYVYVLPTKSEYGVLQFDRKGNFIKRFAKRGNGPGEIGLPQTIYIDKEAKFLFISDFFSVHKYDLNGNFIEKKEIKRPFGYQYLIEDDIVAEVGREYIPFAAPGMFGLGVFNFSNGDTIAVKSDFTSNKVPLEVTGIKQVYCSNSTQGLYVKLASNDTIFNLTANSIMPAYAFDTGNSESYRTSSFNIKEEDDIKDSDFLIWDFCEIGNMFMYRAIMGNHIHIYIYDKENGRFYCKESKYDPNEIIMLNRTFSIGGLYSGNDILPFAPYRIFPQTKCAIQYYTADEILYMKDRGELSASILSTINENSNPVVAIYHIK